MESIRLRLHARGKSAGLFRDVLDRASQDALSGGAMHALRLGEQIGSLVARLKPRLLVVTHEGHAWERVAFAASRKALPGIRCAGYQHAALFRLQHAIRRNLARNFNPDVILTAGTAPRDELERSPGLRGMLVAVLGSNRTFKRAHADGDEAGGLNGSVCLVLPEGFEGECRILFEYSLACAQMFPEVRFIWRLHPSVTFSSLKKKYPEVFRAIPLNIKLSSASLAEDIRDSRWVLYRGSTAVIQSVAAGLRPLYLMSTNEMTIDPLYELGSWRIHLSTPSEFRRFVEQDRKCMQTLSALEMDEAIQYCKALFTAMNPEAIDAFLVRDFRT